MVYHSLWAPPNLANVPLMSLGEFFRFPVPLLKAMKTDVLFIGLSFGVTMRFQAC
jgi:hypothetical protein